MVILPLAMVTNKCIAIITTYALMPATVGTTRFTHTYLHTKNHYKAVTVMDAGSVQGLARNMCKRPVTARSSV